MLQTKILNAAPTPGSRRNIDHTLALWKVLCKRPGYTDGETRFLLPGAQILVGKQ